jgi:hypothetical protein
VSSVTVSCPGHLLICFPNRKEAPIVKDVRPGWHDEVFNGSFLHQNVYRQPAGPEVDAAWGALGINYRSVVVPVEEAEATGLRPEQVQVSQFYGGGFPANVEGLHHLHCLVGSVKTQNWRGVLTGCRIYYANPSIGTTTTTRRRRKARL